MTRLFFILLSVSLTLVSCSPQISGQAASTRPPVQAGSSITATIAASTPFPALTFAKDYFPGTKDPSGNFMEKYEKRY